MAGYSLARQGAEQAIKATPALCDLCGEKTELRASQGCGWRPQVRLVRAIKVCKCFQDPDVQTERAPEALVLAT